MNSLVSQGLHIFVKLSVTKQEKIPKVIKSLGTQLKYQTQQLCLSAAYQDYKTLKDNSINDIVHVRCVPNWKKFDYSKTGSRRSVELPKDLKNQNLTYLARKPRSR